MTQVGSSRRPLGVIQVAFLATLAACGTRGSGPTVSAGERGADRGPNADTEADRPADESGEARTCPPAPALGDMPVLVTSNFGGTSCPAGVCPAYYACGCDRDGRPVFVEHTYSGVPRDRYWIDYDEAGNRVEIRRDYEADGLIDARFTYAHALADRVNAGCVTGTRDEDVDGVAERVCTYADACTDNLVDCRPLSCAPAPTVLAGTPCTPATCPTGAACSCDGRGRVLEVLYNLDADPPPEARTLFWYDDQRNQGHETLPDRQQWYRHGKLENEISTTYDRAGRIIVQATDMDGDGVTEHEVRFTYGGAGDWSTQETWYQDALASRQTRTYGPDGQRITETYQVPGSRGTTMRYFPGAGSDVYQPVVIDSALVSEKQIRCTADDQCVAVPGANCCPCSGGGASVIVHRDHARAVTRAITRQCGRVQTCLGVISTDPTCSADYRPACVQGVCTMRAH